MLCQFLAVLAADLRERGELDLSKCFIDDTFAIAKRRPWRGTDQAMQRYEGHGGGRWRWSSSHRPIVHTAFATPDEVTLVLRILAASFTFVLPGRLNGGGADYLVGESNHLLEVAGRSRRSDFRAAWQQRWQRLTDRIGRGFYVCVAEFETPAGQLAFRA